VVVLLLVGCDLDGVISLPPTPIRPKGEIALLVYYANSVYSGFLEKQHVDIIITSRKAKYSGITCSWLEKNVPEELVKGISICFMPDKMPKTRRNIILYKAHVINELGISKYFEDDIYIVRALTKRCKDCEVIVWPEKS